MRSSSSSRSGAFVFFRVLVRWNVTPLAARMARRRSLPITTRRTGLSARYVPSLRRLQRVRGSPTASGRVLAALTMNTSSSVVVRRGRPPAHVGSKEAMPIWLNRWIISRTRSGVVWTNRAMASTLLPPAEASTTIDRRHFTIDLSVLPPPRRTIRWS